MDPGDLLLMVLHPLFLSILLLICLTLSNTSLIALPCTLQYIITMQDNMEIVWFVSKIVDLVRSTDQRLLSFSQFIVLMSTINCEKYLC